MHIQNRLKSSSVLSWLLPLQVVQVRVHQDQFQGVWLGMETDRVDDVTTESETTYVLWVK